MEGSIITVMYYLLLNCTLKKILKFTPVQLLQVVIANTIHIFDVSFQYFNDELSLGNNVKTSIDQD